MTVHVVSDAEILQEAANILLENMNPSKAVRFWAIWQKGEGNYLQWRDDAFKMETVDSLFEQIKAFQEIETNENV